MIPPPIISPALVMVPAIAVMTHGIIMVVEVITEIACFLPVAPFVPMTITVPVAVAISERRISQRDTEIGGGRRRCGGCNRHTRQGQSDKRAFEDMVHFPNLLCIFNRWEAFPRPFADCIIP
jgi:hypothetical protein